MYPYSHLITIYKNIALKIKLNCLNNTISYFYAQCICRQEFSKWCECKFRKNYYKPSLINQ